MECDNMAKKLQDRLISVKSIVTLALAGTFIFLCVTGKIDSTEFMTVFSTVIAFYFGTQSNKSQK